ncbi:MAG: HAD family phosphatase [Pseudomonadota bacterium]
MMDVSLVIFDCDGVLIDSEVIYLEVERNFLKARSVEVDPEWFVGEFMALALPQWKQKFSDLLREHTGVSLSDKEFEAMKDECRTRIMNEVKVVPGVEDMLGSINAPKCVASSTQRKFLPGKLERTALDGFFGDGVYSGDMVEHGKPAPDLFLHAAKQMGGHAPSTCIVVEDSANGVRGGKAAGMFTIGFMGGSHALGAHDQSLLAAGADLIVEDHAHLKAWLASETNAISS